MNLEAQGWHNDRELQLTFAGLEEGWGLYLGRCFHESYQRTALKGKADEHPDRRKEGEKGGREERRGGLNYFPTDH